MPWEKLWIKSNVEKGVFLDWVTACSSEFPWALFKVSILSHTLCIFHGTFNYGPSLFVRRQLLMLVLQSLVSSMVGILSFLACFFLCLIFSTNMPHNSFYRTLKNYKSKTMHTIQYSCHIYAVAINRLHNYTFAPHPNSNDLQIPKIRI